MFYFVGVVLTYLLWGAILKLRETRTRLIQLVLALGDLFQCRRRLHVRAAQSFSGSRTERPAMVSATMGCVAAAGLGLHVHTRSRRRALEPARLMVRAR